MIIAHHTPMIFSATITNMNEIACRKMYRSSPFHSSFRFTLLISASYLTLNSLTVPQVRQL